MTKTPLIAIATVLAAVLAWWALSGRPAGDEPEGTAPSPESFAAPSPQVPATPVLRAAGAAGRDSPVERAALAGRVLDAATRKPIAGAAVTVVGFEDLRRFETVTRDDGTFAVAEAAGRAGAFHLVVRATGYGRFVDPSARSGDAPRTILLESEGSLVGWLVEDADDSPVVRYRVVAIRRVDHFSDDQSVRNALPDEQVFDAAVSVDDRKGRFRVSGLPAGTFALVFLVENRHPFFWSGGGAYYAKTGFTVAAASATDVGTIRLPRTDRILVRVLDAATEQPLAGATFQASVEVDERAITIPVVPVDSASGRSEYVLALAFDAKRRLLPTHVTVRVVGYAPAPILPAFQGPGELFEVRMSAAASLKGTVRPGEPRGSGLLLLVRRGVDRGVVATAVTGPTGEFLLPELPGATKLELLVFERAADRLRLVVPLQLKPGETRVLALDGANATGVEGRVTLKGAPIVNVWIFLDVGDQRIHCPTDVDGRFRFEAIPAGTYRVFVNGDVVDREVPAYLSRHVTVRDGQMTSLAVDWSWEIRGTLTVRQTDGSPGPADKKSVVAHAKAPSDPSAEWAPETRTRADGSFTLRVPGTGPWVLDLEEEDLVLAEGPVSIDTAGRDFVVDPVKLVATVDARDGTIEIAVRAAETGEPIFGPDYSSWYRQTSAAGSAVEKESVVRQEKAGLGLHHFVIESDDRVPTAIDVELTSANRTVKTTVMLPKSDAVRVKSIDSISRAGAEGLRAGDLILRYGAVFTRNVVEFAAAKKASSPSDRVTLEIVRDGSPTTITVPGGRLGITIENARVPR